MIISMMIYKIKTKFFNSFISYSLKNLKVLSKYKLIVFIQTKYCNLFHENMIEKIYG